MNTHWTTYLSSVDVDVEGSKPFRLPLKGRMMCPPFFVNSVGVEIGWQ